MLYNEAFGWTTRPSRPARQRTAMLNIACGHDAGSLSGSHPVGSWLTFAAFFSMFLSRLARTTLHAGVIVVAVGLAWYLEASSTAFFVLWFVAAVPGSICSAWQLIRPMARRRRLQLRRGAQLYYPEVGRLRRPTGAHLVGQARLAHQPLAAPLLASGCTGTLSRSRSQQPPAAPVRESGGTRAPPRARSCVV